MLRRLIPSSKSISSRSIAIQKTITSRPAPLVPVKRNKKEEEEKQPPPHSRRWWVRALTTHRVVSVYYRDAVSLAADVHWIETLLAVDPPVIVRDKTRVFDFYECHLSDSDLKRMLPLFQQAEELWLGCNQLTIHSLQDMCRSSFPMLKIISFRNNQFTDECIPVLFTLLAQIPSLATLYLNGNQFSAQGRQQLANSPIIRVTV